jgi:uncharacterized protein (DUF58 family)
VQKGERALMKITFDVSSLIPRHPSDRRKPFPLVRTKDVRYHPYFPGAISRGVWLLFAYRFTRPGLWVLLITTIIGAYGSNSLQMQGYVPFLYLAGLWVVASVGARLYRPKVALTVHHTDRIGVGETLPLEITIRTLRRLNPPELNLLPHRLPPPLDAVPTEGVAVAGLQPNKPVRIVLGLRCKKRGVYEWPGFRVETEFPIGLVRSYQTLLLPQRVMVYPDFTPLLRLALTAGRRYQPGGVAMASKVGESFEYMGNRDYREGDDIRHIDWRATARLNAPVVREYREEYLLRVAVILDTHVPADAEPEREEAFERAVSLCAAVSDHMARSDYLVDLFAAGATLYHLLAGRSLASLEQILEILACVEVSAEEPFATLEPELTLYLAQITTIICLFLDWDAARQAFVTRLMREGAGVRVIVVRDGACTLDPRAADLPGGVTQVTAAQFAAGVTEL